MKITRYVRNNRVNIIVGINRQLFIFASLMLLFGILYRNISPFWKSENMSSLLIYYDMLGFFSILYFLTSAMGLSLRKEWGRLFSISANLLIFFVFFGLKIFMILFVFIVENVKTPYLEFFFKTTDNKIESFVSLVAIIMTIIIARKKFKLEFLRVQTN